MTPALEAHFGRLRARHPAATIRMLPGNAALVTVPDLPIPVGWSAPLVTLRFLAPNGYPTAAPDSFWADPGLILRNGQQPKNTQTNHAIPDGGWAGQWFSWHLEAGHWSANFHDFLTWLGMCLERLRRVE